MHGSGSTSVKTKSALLFIKWQVCGIVAFSVLTAGIFVAQFRYAQSHDQYKVVQQSSDALLDGATFADAAGFAHWLGRVDAYLRVTDAFSSNIDSTPLRLALGEVKKNSVARLPSNDAAAVVALRGAIATLGEAAGISMQSAQRRVVALTHYGY